MEKIENIKEISDVITGTQALCAGEIVALSKSSQKDDDIMPRTFEKDLQILENDDIDKINDITNDGLQLLDQDAENILHKIELLEKRVNNESQLNKRIKKLENRVKKLESKTYNFAEVIPIILIIAYILFMILKKKY